MSLNTFPSTKSVNPDFFKKTAASEANTLPALAESTWGEKKTSHDKLAFELMQSLYTGSQKANKEECSGKHSHFENNLQTFFKKRKPPFH